MVWKMKRFSGIRSWLREIGKRRMVRGRDRSEGYTHTSATISTVEKNLVYKVRGHIRGRIGNFFPQAASARMSLPLAAFLAYSATSFAAC